MSTYLMTSKPENVGLVFWMMVSFAPIMFILALVGWNTKTSNNRVVNKENNTYITTTQKKVTATITTETYYADCCMDPGTWYTEEVIKIGNLEEITLYLGKDTNGVKIEHLHRKNGTYYGTSLHWDTNGELTVYRSYDEEGRFDKEFMIFDNGKLIHTNLWKNGQQIWSDVFGKMKKGERVICAERESGQYEYCELSFEGKVVVIKEWDEKGKLIKNTECNPNKFKGKIK